jgi:hypothetical protein
MMKTLALVLALWAQDPQDPPPRERRDPLQRPPAGSPEQPVRPVPPERRPGTPAALLDEVKEWLRVNEPETHRRLLQVQSEGRRDDVMRIVNDAAPRMRELNDLKQRDPRGYEKLMDLRRLERESIDQADAVRKAPADQRDAAAAKLKETLGRLFDAREELRVRELAELKRRVEALEKAVNDRKSAKDRIVEKRKRELLGEKSEDDW